MLTQLNSSVLIPSQVNIEEWYCVGLGGGDFFWVKYTNSDGVHRERGRKVKFVEWAKREIGWNAQNDNIIMIVGVWIKIITQRHLWPLSLIKIFSVHPHTDETGTCRCWLLACCQISQWDAGCAVFLSRTLNRTQQTYIITFGLQSRKCLRFSSNSAQFN